ncbi:Putative protein [Zobellia galactanivorans]|uniref:Uncharacterized protein n=1 Tax=Zobellia galactanivorans (strain DSM 12802 / CCUG 47099 / CIP 106680 / NCIMB 13871 / Dsij) TaxID=63186 RepID=G0L5Q5_ZOBGA|nr:hypothetical protein B4Q04_06370 [Zobellia sp. OII3]CAZ96420.1 Putative protein [Zobellia galactanivorans]
MDAHPKPDDFQAKQTGIVRAPIAKNLKFSFQKFSLHQILVDSLVRRVFKLPKGANKKSLPTRKAFHWPKPIKVLGHNTTGQRY